ncbi:hypothetical protein [Paenibacillus glycanilyticus]|uniref:YxjI n=1 Tax=Paenibacillus glycanilyticus TaxID=126569 RepID=A0ABQ6GKK6_9BACL|nr:hypothetical protein [Paenibacillus glycanilyticus]GLX71247.1 hypothetical protein MU1_55960 [Paenibacillus glycanilyticus]
MQLYFRENFWNAGTTEILDEQENQIGHLDMRSAFSSAIDIYDSKGQLLYNGRFPFFSGKWEVSGADEEQVGVLRSRLSFFSKKYSYETIGRGDYEIISPAFSREYDIIDESENVVAQFKQVNGWLSSGAFVLDNQCEFLDPYELVAVIIGMHAIQKAASSAGTAGT